MKIHWYSSLLMLGAVAGCVPLPVNPKEGELPPPPQFATSQRAPVRPVTPNEVTEANAALKADQLRQELDREAELLVQPPQNH